MADIVERLRGLAEDHFEMLGGIHEPLTEAAEEIERLREQCEWAKKEVEILRVRVSLAEDAMHGYANMCELQAIPDDNINRLHRKLAPFVASAQKGKEIHDALNALPDGVLKNGEQPAWAAVNRASSSVCWKDWKALLDEE